MANPIPQAPQPYPTAPSQQTAQAPQNRIPGPPGGAPTGMAGNPLPPQVNEPPLVVNPVPESPPPQGVAQNGSWGPTPAGAWPSGTPLPPAWQQRVAPQAPPAATYPAGYGPTTVYAQPPGYPQQPQGGPPPGYAAPAPQGYPQSYAPVAPLQPRAIAPTAVAPGAAPAPPPPQPPPLPPPPPPPVVVPYFRSGASAISRAYAYRPPPASHTLYANTRRIVPPQMPPDGVPFVDLRGLLPPVREDGGAPGYASVALREVLYALGYNPPTLLPGPLSPAYLAARAGAPTVADELTALFNYGVAPEEFVEGVTAAVRAEDTSMRASTEEIIRMGFDRCDVAAAPFRLSAVPNQVDFSVLVDERGVPALTNGAGVKYALANKQTIAIGFNVRESFERPGEGGLLPMFDPSEPVLGGYAALVVGYNERGWIVRLAFGPDWGDKGYVVMPFNYELCWYEAWTVRVA